MVPFVAGIGKLDRTRYNSYNIIGGVIWILSFLFAGYFLGNFEFFKKNFSLIVLGIIGFSVIPAIYAVIQSKIQNKKAI